MRRRAILGLVAIAVLGGASVAAWRAYTHASRAAAAPATFVGSATCAGCHRAEHVAWTASQHARAMQGAQPATVAGRFDGGSFVAGGVTSIFHRRGDRLVVNTDGPDGTLRDFEVRYTFGLYPLQQYLVALEGGRLQALSVAWDARPAAAGGQRWFSPNLTEHAAPASALHWTGRQYNWNYMCADCHSTGVRKGYDAPSATYRTTFAEISVGCEACHGPGSRHAAWAEAPRLARALWWRDPGLPARLDERRGVRWTVEGTARTATRSAPRRTDREVETCAQCHARRIHTAEGYSPGARLLDHYIPAFLEPGLYFPDGQQREEVYNYGSFVQSKMFHAGVTCADCHDPHTQRLRRPGNQLCAQCHRPDVYDAPAHHRHPAGSAGASCASCHMPDTTYMRIDPRHDHSIRVPRPDLSVRYGVPNACSRCHGDRDAAWAAAKVRGWYGRDASGFQRFAGAFAADDADAPAAPDSLARVADDSTHPPFVRASALVRLARFASPLATQGVARWTRDRDPLVRLAALQLLEQVEPAQRVAIAAPLLADDRRAVRQGAAWLLAPVADSLPEAVRRAYAAAAAEFVDSQRYNADRAPHLLALGAFYAQRGRLDSAAVALREALRLAPDDPTAREMLQAVERSRR